MFSMNSNILGETNLRVQKSVNDENIGKALKAKGNLPLNPTTKRNALGDLSNQKIPVESGKITKKTVKPRLQTHKTLPKSSEQEAQEEIISEEEAYQRQLEKLGVPDIDKEDANDPQACSEYVTHIFSYLLKLEKKYQPSEGYMSNQAEITWKMRSTLVNWIVEVHWKYKLLSETLFLAINILDRYTPMLQVPKDKLQLVGIASLFIASKFEEIYSPSVDDFLYVCNDGYTLNELLQMERDILYKLQFELGSPCPLTFMRRISKAEKYDIPSRTVAKYLIEITLLDESFLKYNPSLIAAASSWLARKMLKMSAWDTTLQFYSGYKEEELEPCVNDLLSFLGKNSKFKSVYKKYASSKYLRASIFTEEKIQEWMKDKQ